MGYLKNTPADIPFLLINSSTGAKLTGATVTVYRVLDNASQEVAEGSVTEKGNGSYNFAATANDRNADVAAYLFEATNAIPVQVTIIADTGTSTTTYTYAASAAVGDSLEAQLVSVQAAITAIEAGAQSVTQEGRTVTYPDLRTLYAREERLQRAINRAGQGRISVAEF